MALSTQSLVPRTVSGRRALRVRAQSAPAKVAAPSVSEELQNKSINAIR
jgi:hypothetical protein